MGKGCYKIKDIELFFKLYINVCFNLAIECCFLERPINNINKCILDDIEDCNLIKIDIDLKYNNLENITNHFYKVEYVDSLINLYYKHMIKYLNLNEECLFNKNKIINNLKFYVLERSKPYLDKQSNKLK